MQIKRSHPQSTQKSYPDQTILKLENSISIRTGKKNRIYSWFSKTLPAKVNKIYYLQSKDFMSWHNCLSCIKATGTQSTKEVIKYATHMPSFKQLLYQALQSTEHITQIKLPYNYLIIFLFAVVSVTKACPTLATSWIVPRSAPLSLGFPRQEYWSGLQFPSAGDLPNPGEPTSPAWASVFFTSESPWKPI